MRRRLDLSVTLLLYLACYVSVMGWENDLWLLISSYEDVGITVDDLIFFLATHGFDAHPHKSYVTVKFPPTERRSISPQRRRIKAYRPVDEPAYWVFRALQGPA